MLPPDNFQEDPVPVLAHRTSPTNSASISLGGERRGLGWIGMSDAVDRVEATLSTMSGLARFRGHFYNWYARMICDHLILAMSRRSTAAIWLRISRAARACREWANGRSRTRAASPA